MRGDYKITGIFLYKFYASDLVVVSKKLRSKTIGILDYKFESEKKQIENAIRDFANYGFWEVDGRV